MRIRIAFVVLSLLLGAGARAVPATAAPAVAATASISGRTTGPGGAQSNLAWTLVLAYTADGTNPARDYSDENGDYTISGLEPGEYTLRFVSSSPEYAPTLWNEKTNLTDADYITLREGEALTGMDASLKPSSTISGRLTGAGGTALPERGRVVAFSAVETDDLSILSGIVDADGNYSISGFAVGSYKIGFYTGSHEPRSPRELIQGPEYVSAWYGGAFTFAEATEVEISSPGQVVSGVGAQLIRPTFADVGSPSSPFFTPIEWMAASGVATGTHQEVGKPLYKPAAAVSRQAMAAFLYRLSGESFIAPDSASFADVQSSSPFFTAVEWMAASGIATGTAQENGLPLFLGENAVSRQAMALFLARFANVDVTAPPSAASFADVPLDSVAAAAIGWMNSAGISKGTATDSSLPLYKPLDPVSRQAMAVFLFRLTVPT